MTDSRTETRRRSAAGVIICAVAVFAAVTTGAQNLSTTGEGQVVVGQCYAACMDR